MFVPSASPPRELILKPGGYEAVMAERLPFERASRATGDMLALLGDLAATSGGRFRVATSLDDVHASLKDGAIFAIPHIEGAEAVAPNLSNLPDLHERGVRSLGLVWSRPNDFGHGVPFAFPRSPDTGPGLTPAGRELVRACNRLGILIDLSHLNLAGFREVAAISDAPLVATHSCAHRLCRVSRNLTDWQIDAIGASGGVIGIAFDVSMLRWDGALDSDTPLGEIARHVDYVAARVGVDHVALGSDFDGAVMPSTLGDVAGLPRLIDALRARGYDDEALAKITCRNWLRVLEQTWR
jgi:membrane dipeptidase